MIIEFLHDLGTRNGRTSITLFDRSGQTLVVGASKALTRWAVAGDGPPSPRGHARPGRGPRSVTTAGFHPLSPMLVTNGGRVSVASFWSLEDRWGLAPVYVHPWSDKRAAMAAGQAGAAFGLAFRPGTTTLATGHAGGAVRLWDVREPARPYGLGNLRVRVAYVDALAFSPDGATLAVADHAGNVDLWDFTAGAAPAPVTTLTWGRASYLIFSPDGGTLAANTPFAVALWDTADLSPRPAATLAREPVVPTGLARAVAFHPRLPVLACGDQQGAISLWEVSEVRRPRLVSVTPAHHRPITTLSFHPAGNLLAVGARDGMTALWTFAES
ncbi:WD40 repeat domain-containing protein [Nonomuraea sp. NPDC001831]|uniref:WD40 repeat domain-containing protein n=1 Tax=Nonomuraea sp. NPDC001831 TaxID=3364340 RepID=UPI00369286A1